MAIFKFSNAGGFGTYTRYNDFLAGNPAVNLDKGSMYPLGVFTLSAAQASIDITNIPQTYTHLQLRGIVRSSATASDANARIRFNGDTGNNYRFHFLGGNGSSAYSGDSGVASFGYTSVSSAASSTSNTFGAFVLDILDYRSTNKNKTVRTLGAVDMNGSGFVEFHSSLWLNSSTAITSLSVFYSGANLVANSSIALYGVQA